jgi:hypothetical protein
MTPTTAEDTNSRPATPPSPPRANQKVKTRNKHRCGCDDLNLQLCVGPRPGDFDAVLGRGGESNHHEGTKMFRAMVDSRRDDFVMATTNQQKQDIVMSCLACFKARGGRIVGKWKGLYYEASDQRQYSKVIQRLRERNMVQSAARAKGQPQCKPLSSNTWADEDAMVVDTISECLEDSSSSLSLNGLDLGIEPIAFHDVFADQLLPEGGEWHPGGQNAASG